jgi:hypothetical protein
MVSSNHTNWTITVLPDWLETSLCANMSTGFAQSDLGRQSLGVG